jgi:hypothetical protein
MEAAADPLWADVVLIFPHVEADTPGWVKCSRTIDSTFC